MEVLGESSGIPCDLAYASRVYEHVTGASGATRLVAVIVAGSLGVVLDDVVGEHKALTRRVVGVLVPSTLSIQQPVQVVDGP